VKPKAASNHSGNQDRRQRFDRYLAEDFPKVYNYILRLIRSPQSAEDIVQEAFLKAWNAYDRFDPSKPFLPWIMQIARNLALDHLRRRREVPGDESWLEQSPSPAASPERELLRAEEARRLEQALGRLPEPQRTAAYLYYVNGLSLAEIGRVLKKSERAATSLLHRARENLRKQFQE